MSEPLHVLFATAELAPLARVGGLAAASAGLVAELRRQGVTVHLVVPDYFGTPLQDETVRQITNIPGWFQPAVARSGTLDGIGPITLVDVPAIRRPHPYTDAEGRGWPDNDRRFLGFGAAIGGLCAMTQPDILHLNDWHTSVAPAFVWPAPPTVLTIHTLGYQGNTNAGWLNGLWHFRERWWAYDHCIPLVGGIRSADLVITVSPHYAHEITQPATGFGIDWALRAKGDRLVGILNGIDTGEWDPQTDAHLAARYHAARLTGQAKNRAALFDRFGLTPGGGPLVVMVTRLVDQKGVDLALAIVDDLHSADARLAILGSGDRALVGAVEHAVDSHQGLVGFVNGYDEALAHQMFAGGDLFIMPSRFEPCGLAQMQAMRYGTPPLVTDVGGLHDTVVDADAHPDGATGFVADEVSGDGVRRAFARAVAAHQDAKRWRALQRNGMEIDWSWSGPAATHIDWYRRLLEERRSGA